MGLLEFTFFTPHVAQNFIQFVASLGLESKVMEENSPNGEEVVIHIEVTVGFDDERYEMLEQKYDEVFFGAQASEVEGNNDDGAIADACGVQVQLKNGEFTTIAVHPEIMNKVLSVLSVDELQSFLAQVVEDVENPKSGPICSRKDLPTI